MFHIVTGAAGFVGSHLAERLLGQGFEVVGLDNFATGHRRNLEPLSAYPGFHFVEGDIREKSIISRLSPSGKAKGSVFHLAAVVSVPYSVAHPDETMEVNATATKSLLDQSRQFGFQRFVFAGSAAEYGATGLNAVTEADAGPNTKHLSPYGAAKYEATRAVAASPMGVSLRFFNLFGPRQDPSSPYSGVISRFVSFGAQGKPLTVFGDGGQTRDFLYVSDAVDAYLVAAGLAGFSQGDGPLQGVYNVGRGQRLSILDLAEKIKALTGNTLPVEFGPERAGDIRHSLADPSKLLATGYRPRVDVDEGLARTVESLMAHEEATA